MFYFYRQANRLTGFIGVGLLAYHLKKKNANEVDHKPNDKIIGLSPKWSNFDAYYLAALIFNAVHDINKIAQ